MLASVSAELPAAWCSRVAGRAALTLQNVWFMDPPAGQQKMHSGVWRVICLAIFNALDVGRAAVAKKYKELAAQQQVPSRQQQQQQLPPGQLLITAMLQRAALSPEQQAHNARNQQRRQQEQQQQQQQELEDARILEEVKKAAVARFWELVIDFVQLRVAPLGWSQSIPLDHPILRPTDNRLAMQLAPRVGI